MPVIVYFHGGAFSGGNGNTETFGNEFIEDLAARKDVVLVSMNHRLTAFGHLSLDPKIYGKDYAYSGNVGMMDLRLAVQWVQDNIAQFGGDPSNITLTGPSGGGAKTLHAMAMPMFQGTFQHAIILGGHDAWKRNSLKSARQRSAAVVSRLGIQPGDVNALQGVPMARLLSVVQTVKNEMGPDPTAGPRPWVNYDLLMPVIDGVTLPKFPIDAIASGASANVDLMLGTTKMEHWAATAPGGQNPDWGWITFAQLRDTLDDYLEARTDYIIKAYRKMMPGASPSNLLHRIITDRDWHLPHLHIAEAKAAAGKPAYLYLYDEDVANSVLMLGRFTPVLSMAPAADTHGSVGQFATAFTNLAKTGNPNRGDTGDQRIPNWRPFTREHREMMVFGLETHVDEPLNTLSIWEKGPKY